MKNKAKKAFTVVELVIVIAVVAILAAVLIPTFISIIDNANDSADTQNKRNGWVLELISSILGNDDLNEKEYKNTIAFSDDISDDSIIARKTANNPKYLDDIRPDGYDHTIGPALAYMMEYHKDQEDYLYDVIVFTYDDSALGSGKQKIENMENQIGICEEIAQKDFMFNKWILMQTKYSYEPFHYYYKFTKEEIILMAQNDIHCRYFAKGYSSFDSQDEDYKSTPEGKKAYCEIYGDYLLSDNGYLDFFETIMGIGEGLTYTDFYRYFDEQEPNVVDAENLIYAWGNYGESNYYQVKFKDTGSQGNVEDFVSVEVKKWSEIEQEE